LCYPNAATSAGICALLLIPSRWTRSTGLPGAPLLPVGYARSCKIYCPCIRNGLSRHSSVATLASLCAFSFSFSIAFFFTVIAPCRGGFCSFHSSCRCASVEAFCHSHPRGEVFSCCLDTVASSAGGGSPWRPVVMRSPSFPGA